MNEYDIFNGSDPDIANREPKLADDEFQSQVEDTLGEWFPVRAAERGKFLKGMTYRRKTKQKFSYPTQK